MRDILILDCDEVRCPQVLIFVFVELCQAFKDRNYTVKIVHDVREITNNSIVFIGDTFRHPNIATLLNKIAPDAIYVGWYWHKQNTDALKYFIHTYENMLNPDDRVKFLKQKINNCPLLLRASEHPDKISTYEKNIIYDYCYMGANYCQDLVPSKKYKGVHHAAHQHKDYLPYSKRKEIYLSSNFALGFQVNDNIVNKHVSQRIYEGMAYGCIVLTNSIPACEQTQNIPVYVSSRQDLEDKMEFYMANPVLMKQKQIEGYEYIKQYGTNHYAIDKFIHCIKDIFDIVV